MGRGADEEQTGQASVGLVVLALLFSRAVDVQDGEWEVPCLGPCAVRSRVLARGDGASVYDYVRGGITPLCVCRSRWLVHRRSWSSASTVGMDGRCAECVGPYCDAAQRGRVPRRWC